MVNNHRIMDLTITIKEGVGNIKYGMNPDEVIGLWGAAGEKELIEGATEEKTTVLRYLQDGVSLYFEGANPTLTCIELSNEDSTLWGEQLFLLDEEELIQLMKNHNYATPETEIEVWGEKRISYPEGNIDFFFEEGEMTSIALGL